MPSRSDFNQEHSVVTSAAKRRARADENDFAFKSGKRLKAEDCPPQSTAFEKSKDSLSSQTNQTRDIIQTSAAASANVFPPKNSASSKTVKIEKWLASRGHSLTYAFLFAFTLMLYFRPYEIYPELRFLSSLAFYLAVGTLLVFLPSQLAAERTLTARPPEINYVLLFAVFGLITIPLARDSQLAWEAFNEPFIKVVLMFIVMVNVLRTEARLNGMIWLAFAVGVMLAFQMIDNYASGKMLVEDYRAMANSYGVFGNPNAQALHFVTITPLAVALGLASRNLLFRLVYFALAVLFVTGNTLTYSRGGFLGLIVGAVILVWKLAGKYRYQALAAFGVLTLLVIAVAPGNYAMRVLSIFFSDLDPNGSSSNRKELLWTSLIVSLRNPWGIGMNNFPLTNPYRLVSHNSYTQVSAELGVLGLFSYIMLLFEVLRRTFWVERELRAKSEFNRFYYLSVGLQASLAGFCVGSFFDSVAYQWFLYYLAAYAVCLRRIYQLQKAVN